MLGGQSRYVTALPDNEITDACITQLRGLDVDTSKILRTSKGRFGLYFVETGANQRPVLACKRGQIGNRAQRNQIQ